MPSNTDSDAGRSEVSHTRRRFVQAVGATGALSLAPSAVNAVQGEATIQMAMPSPVTQNADATRQALHDAGLSDNISVEFLATSEITGDVRSQYRQWLSAGRQQPDIFRMDSGWTIPFIVRGQLVNLSERLSDEAKAMLEENYFSAMLDTATEPETAPGGGTETATPTPTGTDTAGGEAPLGELYGIPWQVGFPTVQYRKDLVTDAGFDPDGNNWATEPMSWEEFGQVVSQTHEQADVEYGFAWQGNEYEGLACCTFNEFMTSWGGAYFGGRENLFGPVGERPITVTDEQVVDALRMARTFVQGSDDQQALDPYGKISPDAVLQWTEQPSLSAFTNGNAVALRYWPSAIPQARDGFGDDLGVMPIPYGISEDEAEGEGLGGTASALGGWHLTVNPNSQNVDAAVQVLEATMTRSFREFEFSELGFLTPDQRLFNQEDAPEQWGPHMETLRIAGENAIPRPVTVVWPDESPLIAREVNAALAAQKAPQQAMEDLQGSLQEIEESV